MGEERPLRPTSLRAGSTIDHEGIVIEIVEVSRTKDFLGRPLYMISYRIRDGNYVSPVAHWFAYPTDDIKKLVKQTVDFYRSIKDSILKPK